MTHAEVASCAHPRQVALYRRLLRFLPEPLARDHGDDMAALFCHHLMDARGSLGGSTGVCLSALRDLIQHGPRLPRRSIGDPSPKRTPHEDQTMIERAQRFLSNLGRDGRYALRLLRREWTFTLAATLILGLAIGANTAVFSYIDAYLLRPLPYPEAENLAFAAREFTQEGGISVSQDGRTWNAISEAQSTNFDAAVYSGWSTSVNLATGTSATTVGVQRVGAGYFETLGVLPLLGREFTAAEDVPDGPPVTILSHDTWQQLFGEDRSAVGRSVLLRGEPYTVVGVMPPDFRSQAEADLWTPLQPSTSGEGGGTNYAILVRVTDQDSWAGAEAELQSIGMGLNEQIEDPSRRYRLTLTSLQAGQSAGMRSMLTLLAAAVGAVLLIACVNVSGLLLARGARRGAEIATRMAIGGGRAAIIRQFLVESVVLALLGGAAGLLIARVFVSGIASVGRGVLDNWQPVQLDARVLAGTALIALVTALVFGLAPAFQASRISINDALRAGGGRGVAGGGNRWRRGLVVVEVALCVVLLVAAGLLLRTFLHLQGLEPGFDPDGIVTVSVSLQDARYETRQSAEQLFNDGLERVRALPGVVSATAGLGMPYQRLLNMPFRPGDFELPEGWNPITNMMYVSSDYFETLRVRVTEGRGIDTSDVQDSEPVVVINEAFAQRYLPQQARLDRTLDVGQSLRVVGVVETVRQSGRGIGIGGPVAETPIIYVPVSQVSDGFLATVHTWFAPSWIVRVGGEPGEAARNIEQALDGVDPLLPLGATLFASDLRSSATSDQRFTATLVGVLAAAAMVLAGLGIYGLVASTVAERRREIGIRMALGARAAHAIKISAMPSVKLAIAGAVIGIGGSFLAHSGLQSMLYGVAPNDPWTYFGVSGALVIAASIASLIPALRATQVDPANTLRVD
ncbi:MAG: FtsX-like permease family protein [Acidobacteria bacterium]|nr:FtsX-like permease family protein [Acidobacteriota bacterium]